VAQESALGPPPLIDNLAFSGLIADKAFDAAARLAGLKPKIFVESHAPHTLLALAEAGHGVAIIPSQLRTRGYDLRIAGVTYRGKPLREEMIILWHKQRPLRRYAVSYCEMLTEHVRKVFPITRPSVPEADAKLTRNLRRRNG